MIEFFVRNPDFTDGDQIDDYSKFTGIARVSDVGSMALEVPFDPKSTTLGQPGAGLVVVQDGVELMTGMVKEPERAFSTTTDGYVISFVTDEAIAGDTLVYPCAPTAQMGGGYKFNAAEYDVRTGKTETVMYQYAKANAGPVTGTYTWSRPITQLTFAPDLGRGPTVIGRARMDSLLEVLQKLAQLGGLGWRVLNMQLQVYVPTDRTNEIVFSTEIGNINDFKYSVARPAATHFAIGGGGEGTDRLFYLDGDDDMADRWGWRIESFRDRRDTTSIAELAQTYAEEIAEKGEKASFSITPFDIEGYAFGTDYFLGDTVTGEADGQEIVGTINQVTISADSNGELIKPEFSSATTAQAQYVLKTFDIMRKQQRRISALERSL